MTRALRGAAWILVALLVLLLGVFIWLRGSLPQTSGAVTLPGLSASAEVVRDANAVPHIYAESAEDAYFALGFVHAQDRLWQMDFQRRVGAGRLSEVLGEATLDTDRFLRTLGVYRVAERTFENLNAQTQGALLAYTAGVNAFIDERRGPLPPEFLILGYEPEAWTPADSLVWQKMLAWDLGGNWDDELLRARLLAQLSPEQVAELFPPYPGDAPIVLPDFRALYEDIDETLAELWATSPKPLPPGTGSNNWVVSGEKSVTGSPLLANDPHLQLQAPGLWYFAHLSAPGLEVTGVTLPGLPLVVLGRTDRIAWGFTNTGPDVQDLFIERLAEDTPNAYETPDGLEDFVQRSEIIRVKGGDDVLLEVRESRHGPIISNINTAATAVLQEQAAQDAEPAERYALAFAWTTLRDDDLSMQAGLALNRARNWSEFTNALRDFHSPQQSIVYADVDGNIGFYAPARVPVRAAGDGLVPVPGWTGEYDWMGFIPFEDLPHTFNPPEGQVMTANHKIVSDGYPYFLTSEWADPYRAERITDLLGATDAHSLETFRRIQADQVSLMAREFLPALMGTSFESRELRDAQATLLGWDGTMAEDRHEPLLFSAWYSEFTWLLFEDELGKLAAEYRGFRPLTTYEVLQNSPQWCDDVRTGAEETCDVQIRIAFERAVSTSKERFGSNLENWRWGEAHYADNDHPVLADTPLGGFFNLTIPNGGGPFTVNAARFDIGGDYAQSAGPGYRALYDLADLNRSRYIHTTGQSGNVFSRHYRTFTRRWRDVEYITIPNDRSEIEDGMTGVLRLEPGN